MVLSSTPGWARASDASALIVAADQSGDAMPGDTSTGREQASMQLFLSVTVNGKAIGLAEFHSAGGALWASRETLQRIGLRLPPDAAETVRLDRLPGMALHYDEVAQAISLTVPLDMLAAGTTHIDTADEANPRATSSTGVLLNYDAYANYTGGSTSFNTFTELRAFSGNSVLDSTALLSGGGPTAAGDSNAVRLDTGWSTSFPDKMLTLRLGDTLTAATQWSRATRIGGLQFGTNFALQPYRATVPMPAFLGSATLPSKVDLFVDGMRTWSGDVPAGPFALNAGANRINGAGTAQLVMTDMLGQVSTLSFPIYDTPQLLEHGLSDWSVEVGAVRLNYGLSSFDYANEPAVSGTWRHGLTDAVTVETHGEADRFVANFGVGGVWLVGAQAGVVSASLAGSRGPDQSGYQWGLGYSWNNRQFNFAAQTQRSRRTYADVATHWSLPPPRAQDYLQIGYATHLIGSVGLNYVHTRYDGEATYSYAGLFWNNAISRHFSLTLSANQNLNDRHDRVFFLTLNFIPDAKDYFSAGYAHQNGDNSETISAQRTAPQAGGLGWRLDALHNNDDSAGSAQFNYLTSVGEMRAGVGSGNGPTTGYVGYSGSLVLMDNHLFTARHIDDSFAVVSTGNVPDVPVKLANNGVGRTDDNGLLLVPRLNAYQRNVLAIDPTELPATSRVDQLEQFAVPTDRSGIAVHFPITSFGALTMTIVDRAGQIVPEGTAVRIDGREGEPTIVGFDGQFYIENPKPHEVLHVELPGGACRVTLPASPPTNRIDRLGTVQCVPESMP